MPDLNTLLHTFSIWFLPLLLAITLHEAAHGYVSMLYGDKTAFFLGRVSLNPFKHIDPIGTVVIPATLLILQTPWIFGWAKPVPVNPRNFTKSVYALAIVAAAGPAANFLMAFSWALLYKLGMLLYQENSTPALLWLIQTSQVGVFFNIVLALFNLLPIPPLDGGKIIEAFLPYNLAPYFYDLEPYGFLILLTLIITGLITPLIGPPIIYISRFLLAI
ncbi:MAG: site-2 protease family protein [Pseudomonadota bacterium]|nr:site-2 protease family protein [Pseudomonadota bacterium]